MFGEDSSVVKALQRREWRRALKMLRNGRPAVCETDVEYWRFLCCAYVVGARWEEALSIAACGAQRFPGEVVFWECWAWCEYRFGRKKLAIQIMESAPKGFRSAESFAYMFACILAAADRYADARSWLAEARKAANNLRAFEMKVSRQPELQKLLLGEQMWFTA